MGIENLGNNQFGKLAAQNYNKSKAQENAVDLTNNQIKNTTTKGVNLNKGTLQVGQTDLIASFIDKIGDIDDENNSKIDDDNRQKDCGNGKSFSENLRDIQKEESASVEERYRDNEQLALVDCIRAGWRTLFG